MEPCEAIDEAGYECFSSDGDASRTALRMLAKQRDFLRRASQAVNLNEVKRALGKMADKKERLLSEIGRADV